MTAPTPPQHSHDRHNDPSTVSARLAAGQILPGNDHGGDDRDVLTARRYTHPGMEDRSVVRLVPQTLGQAEDLTCEYLGFDAPTSTAEVGTGKRSALGFPAWALVNDPANGHHALNLVKDIERLARTARSKAGNAKDGFTRLGTMLGRAAPHFLPTFYEQAGRIFLEHGNDTYAASMFGKAREAEDVHNLDIDPDRTREVFLEFAFAGALTAKALSAYSKQLIKRGDAETGYELFHTLAVERTRGGLPPYNGMPEDLRRLARAAKRDLGTEDERLLRGVLGSPSLAHASLAFWKSYRSRLIDLARRDASIQRQLLSLIPVGRDVVDLWLEVLTESGTSRLLTEPRSAEEADTGIPARWLSALIAILDRYPRSPRSQPLLELAGAMVGRLVADGEPVELPSHLRTELDLLDLLVAGGVPLGERHQTSTQLWVSAWLDDTQPGRRDLAALAQSARFCGALGAGVVDHARDTANSGVTSAETRAVLAVPGLREALRIWITDRVAAIEPTSLVVLEKHLSELRGLRSPGVFADVPEAADTISRVDVGAALHDSLRSGVFDELGWPALEAGIERLSGPSWNTGDQVEICGEGWPALVLRRGEMFVVVGPEGIVFEHLSRIPKEARHRWRFHPSATWFDGVLLVRWQTGDGESAYWSDAPEVVFEVSQHSSYSNRSIPTPSIALSDGSRFGGGRTVRPGDTSVPRTSDARGDGTTLWNGSRANGVQRWWEVDPATGERGRNSVPAFIEDFAAPNTAVYFGYCDLRPSVPATLGSPLGSADGLHGWRVRRQADGSWLGEGIDGRRVSLSKEQPTPLGQLRLPHGGALTVTAANWHQSLGLHNAHGSSLGQVAVGSEHPQPAAGTPLVAPLAWWHLLVPRDEAGSLNLRTLDRTVVDELIRRVSVELDRHDEELAQLAAAADAAGVVQDKTAAAESGRRLSTLITELVSAAIPAVTHPGLVAGISALVRQAAELSRSYLGFATIAGQARDFDATFEAAPAEASITATDIHTALDWFRNVSTHYRRGREDQANVLPKYFATLDATAAESAVRNKSLVPADVVGWVRWLPHLETLVYRAASEFTPPEQRDALVFLLRTLADSSITDGSGRWRIVTVTAPEGADESEHRVVPMPEGFLVTVERHRSYRRHNSRYQLTGLQFTRTPGSFALAEGWQDESVTPWGTPPEGARLHRLLDLITERGPVAWRPEAVQQLVEHTGMGTAEAAVLLAGMPGINTWESNYLGTELRKRLGLSSAQASAAKERFRNLDDTVRRRLLAAAVPAEPTELWTDGPAVAGIAQVWGAKFGIRHPVPDDVLVEASKRLRLSNVSEWVSGVTNPATTSWLAANADRPDAEGTHRPSFTHVTLEALTMVLPWLAYRLPVGSPLRKQLSASLAAARERVANPDFALTGYWRDLEHLTPLLGGEVTPTGHNTTGEPIAQPRPWLTLALSDRHCRVTVRPGLVEAVDHEVYVAILGGFVGHTHLDRLNALHDERLAAACAGSSTDDTDPAAYAHDPNVSVPQLVAEVAARFGLPEDAAALYLQLLALPDPTDADTARWTGWKPVRLRKARAALAETDLVVTAKRARAGRSLFLPGGWLDFASPRLPLESWKSALYDTTGAVVPHEPVADLFARAWQRILDGDAPAYEELKTGGRR